MPPICIMLSVRPIHTGSIRMINISQLAASWSPVDRSNVAALGGRGIQIQQKICKGQLSASAAR
jgi:hypothetical protein